MKQQRIHRKENPSGPVSYCEDALIHKELWNHSSLFVSTQEYALLKSNHLDLIFRGEKMIKSSVLFLRIMRMGFPWRCPWHHLLPSFLSLLISAGLGAFAFAVCAWLSCSLHPSPIICMWTSPGIDWPTALSSLFQVTQLIVGVAASNWHRKRRAAREKVLRVSWRCWARASQAAHGRGLLTVSSCPGQLRCFRGWHMWRPKFVSQSISFSLVVTGKYLPDFCNRMFVAGACLWCYNFHLLFIYFLVGDLGRRHLGFCDWFHFIYFLKNLFILFLAVLGLCCCVWAFL